MGTVWCLLKVSFIYCVGKYKLQKPCSLETFNGGPCRMSMTCPPTHPPTPPQQYNNLTNQTNREVLLSWRIARTQMFNKGRCLSVKQIKPERFHITTTSCCTFLSMLISGARTDVTIVCQENIIIYIYISMEIICFIMHATGEAAQGDLPDRVQSTAAWDSLTRARVGVTWVHKQIPSNNGQCVSCCVRFAIFETNTQPPP